MQDLLGELQPVGQEHLLDFWGQLDSQQQAQLRRDIQQAKVARFIQRVAAPALACEKKNAGATPDWAELAARAKPPRAYRCDGSGGKFSPAEAKKVGAEALRAGKLAMILVAGGQGSRLGFDHPKGMFPLGPVSHRTLFEIIIDKLRAVARRYGASIPLYVMTSPATHNETVEFLAAHGRFGLADNELHIFCQGVTPAVDAATGKVLLAEKHALFLAPDGHGGMLAALAESGCLENARRRGVEQFFYGQIDNPLITVCDPQLIGYHLLERSEMTTQVVQKAHPLEKVGNVVSIDGRVQIIEYSDLPEEAANRKDAQGRPELWAGNIAVHVFDAAFLARMAEQENALPWHLAHKPAPFVDESGRLVTPDEPNAIKFEQFIFDLLPFAENAIAVEADKAEAFAPVKNSDDAPSDTPSTAQAAMIAHDAALLRAAGATVDDGIAVEINPRFALDADELAQKIEPGLRITQDSYFPPT